MALQHLVAVLLGVALLGKASAQVPYRALACDGRDVYLSCSPGTEVLIQDAFYGRNDTVTCISTDRDSVTPCSAAGARQTVASFCNGKQNCLVRASDDVFGTPARCSSRTTKVLLVNYMCTLAQNTALICGGTGRLSLTCPVGQTLEILSAFYGRDDQTTCPHATAARAPPTCVGNNTMRVVNQTCFGLRQCELFARTGIYGDPCPGVYKYLRVQYACVGCENRHSSDIECEQWSLEGECTQNPSWMDNNCRRACRGCSGTTPVCENLESEEDCDFWAGRGDCIEGDFVSWMMTRCRKSCTRCSKAATCQNTWTASGNRSCSELALRGECWRDPAFMLVNCAGQCLCPSNRQRDTATVQCTNLWRGDYQNNTAGQTDADCARWVANGDCQSNPGFMFSNCFRSCTNCTATPICENTEDDANCDVYLNDGECTKNPLWMFTRCYRACTGCTPEPACENVHGSDAECEFWRGQGLCETNPTFMMPNCWKACSRCAPKPITPVCSNDFGDDQVCDTYRNNSDCHQSPEWMLTNCRKSCTFCDYPFLQHAVQGPHPFAGESSVMTRGRTFVLPGPIRENGILSHYTAFFTNRNPVSLEIWRPDNRGGFIQVTNTSYTPMVSRGPQTVPAACAEVKIGDRVGFSSINNRPSPIAYRFDLSAVSNHTSFRTAFSRASFDSMRLPYVFSEAAVYDYTKTRC